MDRTLKLTAALVVVVVIGCALLLFSGILASSAPVDNPGDPQFSENLTVMFFYGEECSHCHTVMPFVANLSKKYPEIEFRYLEIWHNQKNYATFTRMNDNLNRSSASVPQAIVGSVVLQGEREIPDGLEAAIQEQLKKKT